MNLLATVMPVHRFVEMWVDGGVFNANPSPRGVYWSLRVEDGHERPVERFKSAKYTTNNEAEWLALREALRRTVEQYHDRPTVIYSDSQLIVNQFNGRFAIKEERLRLFWIECRNLFGQIDFVSVQMPARRCQDCGCVVPDPRWRRCPNVACNATLKSGWRPREVMLEKLGH